MQEKAEAFMLKQAENMLEYEAVRAAGLEKMYKADDVVERPNEIILKRQRDAVEHAKFALEVAKMFHDTAVAVHHSP